jgi:hypothetical protein
MNSRRKFLIKGSLATTALIAAQPFKAIAGAAASLSGINSSNNHLVFLHTTDLKAGANEMARKFIADIKGNTSNTILLHTGKKQSESIQFDAAVNSDNAILQTNSEYHILDKKGIKTGVIYAMPGDNEIINKTNRLAAFLKKEKDCQLVVCLSQLGYKNNGTTDDITLASESVHLDMIISGHTNNFSARPVVAQNKKKQEVIIHASAGTAHACGKIEISFDQYGTKSQVILQNKLSPEAIKKNYIKAA